MIYRRRRSVLLVTFSSLLFGIIFMVLNVYHSCNLRAQPLATTALDNKRTYWIWDKNVRHKLCLVSLNLVTNIIYFQPDGSRFEHVRAVFERVGYAQGSYYSNWSVLCSHWYPFIVLEKELSSKKPCQKVNHFPGSLYISSKVCLATSNITYVPKAFYMPKQKEQLYRYAKEHPDKKFVEKNKVHRGIKIKNINELDVTTEGTFIQEFVENPLLIDERWFDIGMYVMITSVDPLRVYIYERDYRLRFCPEKYYPFDSNNLDKYVVKDNYLTPWEMPSLKHYYNELGYNSKDSLSAYFKSVGINPERIYTQIHAAVMEVTLKKELKILSLLQKFPHKRSYFELYRFDFVVDKYLTVYLLEANMSPDLTSTAFAEYKPLKEQVIFNLLSLVGVASRLHQDSLCQTDEDSWTMQVADQDIAVYSKECSSEECANDCSKFICQLCRQCWNADVVSILKESYRENRDKHACIRLIPPTKDSVPAVHSDDLTDANKLLFLWYEGKCKVDKSFC